MAGYRAHPRWTDRRSRWDRRADACVRRGGRDCTDEGLRPGHRDRRSVLGSVDLGIDQLSAPSSIRRPLGACPNREIRTRSCRQMPEHHEVKTKNAESHKYAEQHVKPALSSSRLLSCANSASKTAVCCPAIVAASISVASRIDVATSALHSRQYFSALPGSSYHKRYTAQETVLHRPSDRITSTSLPGLLFASINSTATLWQRNAY